MMIKGTKLRAKLTSQHGFTIIELMVALVVVGLLVALIVSTHASVERNQRNQTRENDISNIYEQLEAYYVDNSQYPTLADMNNPAWLAINMKNLNTGDLRDPSGKNETLVSYPAKNVYSYDVTSTDGSVCNDTTKICAHYTLTATLEDSFTKTFVKSSLN
jgi:prepilin-type N-terminal cleavage/methylation domain-containing protein